jgi:hypothetical protein
MFRCLRVARHFAASRTTNSRLLDDFTGADCRCPSSPTQDRRVMSRSSRPPSRISHGFERHPANRAGAGFRPNDLRMHRTGPQRLARTSRRYRRLVVELMGRDVASRLDDEAIPASGAAKVVAVPGMLGALSGCRRIAAHAARLIARSSLGCRLMPTGGASEAVSGAHSKILPSRFRLPPTLTFSEP